MLPQNWVASALIAPAKPHSKTPQRTGLRAAPDDHRLSSRLGFTQAGDGGVSRGQDRQAAGFVQPGRAETEM